MNCQYFNSRTGNDVGLPESASFRLRSIPDFILLEDGTLEAGHFAGMEDVWTIKNFGPITIPSKGSSVILDSSMVATYSEVLEYELGNTPQPDGRLYTFRHNYYFFAGDNLINSRDSRYFGFVPDEFIIGLVNINIKK